MNPFLAAQARDSFDPMPVLVWANYLEERGDLAGVEALRGLAEAGYASPAGLAWMLAAEPPADDFRLEYRPPIDLAIGFGRGDGFGDRGGDGSGEADGLNDLADGGGDGEGLVGIDAAEVERIGGRG